MTCSEKIGKSFVPDQAWNYDGAGHGTHCAGTIAGGQTDKGIRYGVAPEVDLLIGKVLADGGAGRGSWIIDGIDWAIEKQAKVLSLSVGAPVKIGESPSPIFERIGKRALDNNCLIVAAAGNNSRRPHRLPEPVCNPANADSILAVAGVDRALQVAAFSNGGLNAFNGGQIDLAAPSVDVLSAYSDNAPNGGHYLSMRGTSMAAPHVAGVAALYREKFPDLSAKAIWIKMCENAKHLPTQKYRDVGHGLVQVI